jgi:hypothetical protein
MVYRPWPSLLENEFRGTGILLFHFPFVIFHLPFSISASGNENENDKRKMENGFTQRSTCLQFDFSRRGAVRDDVYGTCQMSV